MARGAFDFDAIGFILSRAHHELSRGQRDHFRADVAVRGNRDGIWTENLDDPDRNSKRSECMPTAVLALLAPAHASAVAHAAPASSGKDSSMPSLPPRANRVGHVIAINGGSHERTSPFETRCGSGHGDSARAIGLHLGDQPRSHADSTGVTPPGAVDRSSREMRSTGPQPFRRNQYRPG
jgi:hypothetical protein